MRRNWKRVRFGFEEYALVSFYFMTNAEKKRVSFSRSLIGEYENRLLAYSKGISIRRRRALV
jgi:hypothetical protein